MKKEEIKKHLSRVISHLERVLYEMKSVVIELKDVIQQIDIMTKQIAKDYGLNLNEMDQQLKNQRTHGLWKLMQKYGICRESENIICRIPSHFNIIELIPEKIPTTIIEEHKEITSSKSKINGLKDYPSSIWRDKIDLELDMSITKEKMDFEMDTLKNLQLHNAFSYEEKLEDILENCESSFSDTFTNVTSDFYKADYNRDLNTWLAYPLVHIDDTWDV